MENGVVNVARALDPREWEIHVACLERRGAFAERLPEPANVVVLGKTGGFSLNVPRDALVAGIVGRFGAFKRHAALIAAFETLAAEFPTLHLLVVGGGGPESENVARQVGVSLYRERIHLAGFQSDPLPFYRAMNL